MSNDGKMVIEAFFGNLGQTGGGTLLGELQLIREKMGDPVFTKFCKARKDHSGRQLLAEVKRWRIASQLPGIADFVRSEIASAESLT